MSVYADSNLIEIKEFIKNEPSFSQEYISKNMTKTYYELITIRSTHLL